MLFSGFARAVLARSVGLRLVTRILTLTLTLALTLTLTLTLIPTLTPTQVAVAALLGVALVALRARRR